MNLYDATIVLKKKKIKGKFLADSMSDDRLRNGYFVAIENKDGLYNSETYSGSRLNIVLHTYEWHIIVKGKKLTAVSEHGTNFGIDGK